MKILKTKDKLEKNYTVKDKLSNLPARILIVGKSALSGKTNLLVNLLCRDGPDFYNNDFNQGSNIYLVSSSIGIDDKLDKLINFKDIPDENLLLKFNEDNLTEIYDEIQNKFKLAVEEKRKENYLLILDDCSYNGDLKSKKNGIINKIASNGRHINLSIIVTAQKYSDLLTSLRENMTMGIFFACSNKQLDLISEDVNYYADNKDFKRAFRDATSEMHSFFVVNFFRPISEMYLNSRFEVIKLKKKD
jgi:hypothetical protein